MQYDKNAAKNQCQWQNKICHIDIPSLYIELYPFFLLDKKDLKALIPCCDL